MFKGLQVPSDNLGNVVMSEIEEPMDYEDSNKDNQKWTDGLKEGVSLADESSKGPDESLLTTAEISDQVAKDIGKEAPVDDEPSSLADVRMSKAHGPTEANEFGDRAIGIMSLDFCMTGKSL